MPNTMSAAKLAVMPHESAVVSTTNQRPATRGPGPYKSGAQAPRAGGLARNKGPLVYALRHYECLGLCPLNPVTRAKYRAACRIRRVGGIVIPRASAVFRWRSSVNFVGCSTGRSAGYVPLRILST